MTATRRRGLQVAPNLTLPVDAVTETFALLAKRGAGKSNAAVKMAEEMYAHGLTWVAVDPKGDWWGIRSSRNGKAAGLPVLILGGRHGDVPLEPTAGRVVADLIAREHVTAVIDVSMMSKADARRFLTDFAERLYQTNTDPLHVFAEEAHEYIPQRVTAGDTRMVGAWEKLVKWGRTHGLGVTLITQRSASLNNDVLTQVETLIALRTTGPSDQKAIRAWVDEHETGAAMIAQLRKLGNGEAFVLSPQWLELAEPLRIRFHQRTTFDSGATPKAGEKRVTPRTFADVDLDALKAAMADTLEKAKADDPRALRLRIAELEQQLAATGDATSEPVEIPVEVPVLTQAQEKLIDEVTERVREHAGDVAHQATAAVDDIKDQVSILARMLDEVRTLTSRRPDVTARPPRPATTASSRRSASTPTSDREKAAPPSPSLPATRTNATDGDVPPARRRLLEVLVTLDSIGVDTAPRNQVALLAGVSPKSSGFQNNLGALRTAGMIDYPARGEVQITDEGRSHAAEAPRMATTAELHTRVREVVSPARWRLLEPLLKAYPSPVSKDDLADAAGVSPKSSGFQNNLGALRSLGLLDYPTPGFVVASPLLFLAE